jgi:hypothetical protein
MRLVSWKICSMMRIIIRMRYCVKPPGLCGNILRKSPGCIIVHHACQYVHNFMRSCAYILEHAHGMNIYNQRGMHISYWLSQKNNSGNTHTHTHTHTHTKRKNEVVSYFALSQVQISWRSEVRGRD